MAIPCIFFISPTFDRSNTPNTSINDQIASPSTVSNAGPKKRNSTPRARANPKTTAAARAAAKNRAAVQYQAQEEIQPQQPVNDPSRYAMVTQGQPQQQQQQFNKVSGYKPQLPLFST